jgi:hypothetical protein
MLPMATTAKAVERIAAEIDRHYGSVDVVSRHLKNAPDRLFAKGPKGGGKDAAQVEASDMANLLLGVLAAEVLAEAPALVRQYRELMPVQATITEITVDDGREISQQTAYQFRVSEAPASDYLRYFWKRPLGLALERIINDLVTEDRALPFEMESFTVVRGKPRAQLCLRTLDNLFVVIVYCQAQEILPLPVESTETAPRKASAPLRVPAVVPAQIFPILAELVRDTRNRRGGKRPLDSGPETSTPATGGAGPASDLVSHPHVNAGLGGTSNTISA